MPQELYSRLSVQQEGAIRLLRILPDYEPGEFRGSLEISMLQNRPKYYALSYTWGPPTEEAARAGMSNTKNRAITCNGHSLLVTENLHASLVRLSRQFDFRASFWIDAICINQENASERGHQVNFMADIYNSAERVLAWLGEEDEFTQPAFDLLKALAKHSDEELHSITPENLDSTRAIELLGCFNNLAYWKALAQLYRRFWFTRVWIIQEIILAREATVLCGGFSINYRDVVQVSRYITTSPWTRFFDGPPSFYATSSTTSQHRTPAILNASKRAREAREVQLFLHTLIRARPFCATDPRDKVYALLGIAIPKARREPKDTSLYPNYERTTAEVYTLVALHILKDSDDLLLLSCVEGDEFCVTAGLPSWVPDWSVPQRLGLGITGYKRFSAAGKLKREITIQYKSQSLRLEAAALDSIVQIGETKHEVNKGHLFPRWMDIIADLPPLYHTGQNRINVFWRTLITDTAGVPPLHPASNAIGSFFRAWLLSKAAMAITGIPAESRNATDVASFLRKFDRFSASDPTDCAPSTPTACEIRAHADSLNKSAISVPGSAEKNADLYDVAFSHAVHLRLFRTSQGFLGLGSESLRSGDSVWIVPGSPVPLILRKPQQGERFHLVGGTYLHGFMDGESLDLQSLYFHTIELE